MSTPTEGLTLGAVSALIERKILTDIVRISRAGEPVFNPDTGQYEPGQGFGIVGWRPLPDG
ncbi:hypothetical protein ACGFY7_50105 [Streptomyces prunicolor]|uniref:hypothetical protein n=1 Tax=Streptomyces prunicolor TaxID=67348 RepID=UPI0037205D4B